ncbi:MULTISPECIES: RrF2 family transcriptional regulator [Micromonospora]|uniref:Transcriptional regulator, BadM/Rrf2 family n=1 Tax=Micromonospora rifamycinica TaxID=291594 RepID=A0A125Q1G2_9ACTN|nr:MULTISPECIES: Rrf2 family transcriptional regulator [Micromonospora]KWV32047.1 Rrf2 family transcriptional regulator [Micromonospora rifamycinica]WFE62194.1 Rrf2 family transcriptional regulator [Micromonospora sp. WMMD714]SCG79599.1 transcriptional regulator, BadM/Rrf2 family [Micromonospora rifamycinica]
MYISARSDYALRAMLAVAASGGGHAGPDDGTGRPDGGVGGDLVKAASLAQAQGIPLSFLQGILLDLRRAGLLLSHRGTEGGYALTRPAAQISVGDVLRAVGGSLTTVRGLPAEDAGYHGVAAGLRDVWLAVDGAIAVVVDRTTLTDLLVHREQTAAR